MAAPRKSAASAASKWRNRIVGTGEVDPATLVPNKLNWRTHPQAQSQALQGALDQLGWLHHVIVNQSSGQLVDGHLRVALAVQNREASIPVVYVDLTPEEERLALVTLDPIAALAEADTDSLNTLLRHVATQDDGIQQLLEGLAIQHDLVPPEPGASTPRGAGAGGQAVDTMPQEAPESNVHMVQLFLTEGTYPLFKGQCDVLAVEYGTDTMTDTIMECVRRAVDKDVPF